MSFQLHKLIYQSALCKIKFFIAVINSFYKKRTLRNFKFHFCEIDKLIFFIIIINLLNFFNNKKKNELFCMSMRYYFQRNRLFWKLGKSNFGWREICFLEWPLQCWKYVKEINENISSVTVNLKLWIYFQLEEISQFLLQKLKTTLSPEGFHG